MEDKLTEEREGRNRGSIKCFLFSKNPPSPQDHPTGEHLLLQRVILSRLAIKRHVFCLLHASRILPLLCFPISILLETLSVLLSLGWARRDLLTLTFSSAQNLLRLSSAFKGASELCILRTSLPVARTLHLFSTTLTTNFWLPWCTKPSPHNRSLRLVSTIHMTLNS